MNSSRFGGGFRTADGTSGAKSSQNDYLTRQAVQMEFKEKSLESYN